ncbi:alpha/beta hydrolase family protein [Geminicoccus harenae]|uniref:alpha/beta hydrolase family protein n=1 Tax=Geminicoccus harenae TaxID=2498453 RepID=UPI001C985D12|nr:hypothetical protein [Geminicoccus harenae]
MTRLWIALLLALASLSAQAQAPPEPGIRSLPAPVAGGSIDLWFPAAAGGRPETVGASPVFQGVPARRDAALPDGRLPLILLAHGGLRASPHLGDWLAAALARRGHLVLVIPPAAHAEADAAAAVQQVWQRPVDLAMALSALDAEPELADRVDRDRVAVVGFFLGGTAALALGGAELDLARFRMTCRHHPASPDCHWFARQGVDPAALDLAGIAGSRRDPRIRAVVAVNPELAASFAPASLAALAVPAVILSLGEASDLPPWLDPAPLADADPGLRPRIIPDAGPFSAFPECAAAAPALLAEEGEDDTLCREPAEGPRAAAHQRIALAIAAALARSLAGQPASGPVQ